MMHCNNDMLFNSPVASSLTVNFSFRLKALRETARPWRLRRRRGRVHDSAMPPQVAGCAAGVPAIRR
jgi:hypothetical protein